MKIKTFHSSLVSLSAVRIKAMGKLFEVLRTYRGSVTMPTIYVVIFGKSQYAMSS